MKLKTLLRIFCEILDCCPNADDAEQAGAFVVQITLPENKLFGEITKMELREGQKVTATVAVKTARGNDASIQPGTGSWDSSNEDVVSVTPNPENELEATIRGLDGDENATAVVTFRADGDDTEGETEVVATLDVVCTKGKAVVAEITTNTPADDSDEASA